MAIPISYVDNYSAALNRATSTARTAAFDALQKIDYSADIADIRDASIAVLETACAASAQVSATVANEFYNAVRVLETGERIAAIVDTGRKPEATAEAVRAFVQLLVDGASPEDFIARCVDRVDYETRKAANMNMAANAKRDKRKPKFARVPTGSETCAWCLLLASFGFRYNNMDVASHSHEDCDCRVIPSWSDDAAINGYEDTLKGYEELYAQAEHLRTHPKEQPDDLRMRIASAKNKHLADQSAGKTTAKWSAMNELAIIARYIRPGLH